VSRTRRAHVDGSVDAAPRARSAGLNTDLPTTVGWLALLIVGGALVALSVDVVPYWTIDHHGVDLAIGVAMLPIGVAMFLLRRHASQPTIHAGLVVGIVCITGSVWAVGPSAESQAPALFYGFLSAFACVYLTRRQAVGYLAFAGALYLGALLSHWRADMASQWVMNMFAMTVPCLTISVLVGRLRGLALRDALTGLANRRMLEECLPQSMRVAARSGADLTVVALDIDNLKSVNDTAGHAAGDRMIVEATQRWSSTLRSLDLLARVGGDEFVLVMPAVDAQRAVSAIDRMRDIAPDVRFSAGIASWEGEAGHQLLHRADAALYTAKTGGRNRTIVATQRGAAPSSSGGGSGPDADHGVHQAREGDVEVIASQ
jgi:diguanylate cyclase (GGDEF)-like protein